MPNWTMKNYINEFSKLFVLERASISLFQRILNIDFNHASRLVDMLEERGIVGRRNSIGGLEIKVPLEALREMD